MTVRVFGLSAKDAAPGAAPRSTLELASVNGILADWSGATTDCTASRQSIRRESVR